MKAGGRRVACLLLCLAFLPGCRRNDMLENELRYRENLYREALGEQRKADCRIDALQRENAALRSGQIVTPEQAASMGGVKRITLGRLTGGYDQDCLPGDEALQVVVEPRDCDDHVIKAPGTLQILALDISPQGLKTPVSSWELSPEELRRSWKQGLLSTGYSLILPWKHFPRAEQLRIVVRLIVTDGRAYEADKDVRIHPLPGAVEHYNDPPPELPPPRQLPADTGPEVRPPVIEPSRSLPPAKQAQRASGEWHTARPAWTPAAQQPAIRLGQPTPLDEPAPALRLTAETGR